MKKTSIAFILAFLSQSALASDDFEIKNLDILAYSGSQDVSLMDAISGDQWDVSYDYAATAPTSFVSTACCSSSKLGKCQFLPLSVRFSQINFPDSTVFVFEDH